MRPCPTRIASRATRRRALPQRVPGPGSRRSRATTNAPKPPALASRGPQGSDRVAATRSAGTVSMWTPPSFWNFVGRFSHPEARPTSPRRSARSQRRTTTRSAARAGPVARSGTFGGRPASSADGPGGGRRPAGTGVDAGAAASTAGALRTRTSRGRAASPQADRAPASDSATATATAGPTWVMPPGPTGRCSHLRAFGARCPRAPLTARRRRAATLCRRDDCPRPAAGIRWGP